MLIKATPLIHYMKDNGIMHSNLWPVVTTRAKKTRFTDFLSLDKNDRHITSSRSNEFQEFNLEIQTHRQSYGEKRYP